VIALELFREERNASIRVDSHYGLLKVSLEWITLLLIILIVSGCGSNASKVCSTPREGGTVQKNYDTQPALTISPSNRYVATFETERGNIVVELFPTDAPRTVNNFVFLARDGFYDNSTFHRVLPGFMAQGGDPTGTGRGGPGYRFNDEFSSNLRHDKPGILSMANAGPNTNGSQFFITYSATPQLDDRHSVFGKVIDGMDALNSLTPRDPTKGPSQPGDTLLCITILETSN